MTDNADFEPIMKKLTEDSANELANNPEAATGKCVISTKGWSECKDGMTETACNNQKGPGVTVKWTKGASC